MDSERKGKNQHLLNKLIEIRHRPRKSIDEITHCKVSLKNDFREKERSMEIEKDNLKLYNRLKSVKSAVKNIDLKKDVRKRERFSETLHYQGQVYKTFTNFLSSSHNPKMFLRTENCTSRKEGPAFKVEVVEMVPEQSPPKTKKKCKKTFRRRSKPSIEEVKFSSELL